jgi:outer membrane protein assembly factor BamB
MQEDRMRSLLLAVLAILGLSVAAGPAHAAGQVWPASGGGGMRLGYTPLHFPQTHSVPWSVDLAGTGIGDSSPVVDEYHRIYIATNDDTPRMTQSRLYCLGSDGTLIWRVPIGARLTFQPILLAGGTILVISDQKRLFAFNPDGTARWNLQLNSAPGVNNADFANNYHSASRQPAHIQPVPDSAGGFFAVDDTSAVISFDGNGARRWTTTFLNTPLGGLTMGNGTIYLPTSDGWLHIYSSLTGKDLGPVGLNGTAAFYGTYMPGSFLYYPVLTANGPHVLALSIAGIQPFDFPLSLAPSAPLVIDAGGNAVVSIGAAGSQDKAVMTDGQLFGLNKAGNSTWNRDFSAVPDSIVSDANGMVCFGTQGIGQSGVYCIHPQRGVQWWSLTPGAASVFPVDENLLGVVVFYGSQFNKTTLMTVGG